MLCIPPIGVARWHVRAIAPATAEPRVVYQPAKNRQQRIGAFRLLHDRYVENGLGHSDATGLRVIPAQLRRDSQIFVGLERRRVVATVTLVGETDEALPLADLFGEELARIRDQFETVVELTSLAISRDHARSTTFAGLTSIAVQYARFHGVRALLATVHPRHARVYCRVLGFRQVGEIQPHEGVRGNPAALIVIPTDQPELLRPNWRSWYFGHRFRARELSPRPITATDREFFAPHVSAARCYPVSDCSDPARSSM